MKNACIVVQKRIEPAHNGVSSVLRAFADCGYFFSEVRILLQRETEKLQKTVAELKKEAENILLLADKSALTVIKGSFLDSFSNATMKNSLSGAGIYADKNSALFLLSADETETGAAYVKNACVSFLQQKQGVRFDKLSIRAVGANERRVLGLLSDAATVGEGKITCLYTRKYEEDRIEILYDDRTPKMLIDDVLRLFVEGLGDTVYALNDVSLEEQVISLLKLRKRKISVAESFTGGGIAKRLTSVSGASAVYFEGLNTYHEDSKRKRLGVNEFTLRSKGAVSDQTAYEMAAGLLQTGDCDVALATTGLAGPNSDRFGLPVGLCFLAVGTKERIRVYRYVFNGNREEITEKAINYALYYAYRLLKDE
ncbi:MAG: CinA family protein [Clostridiales bacterium]|nr:CinA family protein [Clostridiales bacterium]MBQ2769269.1 CinA family protein [Clostridia bacterium]